MFTITPHDLLFLIIFTLFGLGGVSTILGIIVLTTRAVGSDVQTLAVQTSRLAQKGLAEDVAGLVGNASSLLEGINQLVKNTAGVGAFLTILGLLLMTAAGLLTLKIYMG
jgi:uncharacterized protein YoxC